jgi:hypothetical protein
MSFGWRPDAEMKAKKILHFGKAGNEGISQLAPKQMARLASSFSLSEKRPARSGTDERNQTGILTFGLNLAPAFPSRIPQSREDSGIRSS